VSDPWFIVMHEWQAAQDMSNDATWYPSAQIFSSQEGALYSIDMLRKGETPRRGHVTNRNIRGPFRWVEIL
jgi:hypothetical protein